MGFLQSKQFLVTAVLGAIVIAGGAAAYSWIGPGSGSFSWGSHDACEIHPTGTPLDTPPPREDSQSGSGRTQMRALAYDVNVSGPRVALVDACTAVGTVRVEPSPDALAHVVFAIEGDAAGIADTEVQLKLTRASDGALQIAAWESRAGTSGGAFERRGTSVDVTIQVPELGGLDVRATDSVGDVVLTGLLVANVTLSTDVGSVRATDVDITGDVTMSSNVDDVELRAASIQSSRVKLATDVGSVHATFPQRADLGFDATGTSDVGEVTMDIGPTELRDSKEDGAGGHVHARSKDYDSKLAHVVVTATANVGDVTILAR